MLYQHFMVRYLQSQVVLIFSAICSIAQRDIVLPTFRAVWIHKEYV